MNIPQDVLIDVGLSVAGYVLSGLIAVVLYSMASRRKNATLSLATPTGSPRLVQHAPVPMMQLRPDASVEFVRFGDDRPRQQAVEPKSTMSPMDRRNIVETIATARRMMEAGTTAEQIKKTLPISDAELALLKFEIER